jgi:alpha-tubulin suppressor-like RCC1 family protein
VPVRVSGRRPFTAISAGQGDHACALALSGSIYCWGAGGLGQRGDGTTVSSWSPTRVLSVTTPM